MSSAFSIAATQAPAPARLSKRVSRCAVRKTQAHFTLRYDNQLGWVIDGGAVHGIAQPVRGETTVLAIFDLQAAPSDWRRPDAALATAEVEEVRPELSRVRLQSSGDK